MLLPWYTMVTTWYHHRVQHILPWYTTFIPGSWYTMVYHGIPWYTSISWYNIFYHGSIFRRYRGIPWWTMVRYHGTVYGIFTIVNPSKKFIVYHGFFGTGKLWKNTMVFGGGILLWFTMLKCHPKIPLFLPQYTMVLIPWCFCNTTVSVP